MLKRAHLIAFAIALLAALAGSSVVMAQSPLPRGPVVAQREFRVKQVLGTKVSIQGDLAIGTVDDIVFGDDGYVEYLIVLNEGKLVTVPWEAAKFNFENRTATVNITREQFKLIPTYTVERYPTYYAPAYRTEIYKFYGLTPRHERRIERKEIRNP
jgi:hypothetical protein